MALTHSPKIVRDGLAFCIDFKNVKSWQSGSSVTDIISKSTGSTVGTIDRTNGIQCNGTTDGITMTAGTELGGNGHCLSFMIRLPSTQLETWWNFLIRDDRSLADVPVRFELGTYGTGSTTFYYKDNLTDGGAKTMAATLGDDQWRYVVVGQDASGVGKMYLDGKLVTSVSGYSPGSLLKVTRICSEGTNEYKCDLLYFAGYNKMLSENEVKQNFEALRDRVGI